MFLCLWYHKCSSFSTHPKRHPDRLSNRQVLAAERRSGRARVIRHDSLNSSVQTRTEQEKTTEHDEDVNDSHNRAADRVEKVALIQLPVGNSEEDEAEE